MSKLLKNDKTTKIKIILVLSSFSFQKNKAMFQQEPETHEKLLVTIREPNMAIEIALTSLELLLKLL